MFISSAWATDTVAAVTTAATPSTGEAFMWNMGLILVMFVLFYVLLIRPQQRRLKAQQDMLQSIERGDKVVTGGGFIGTVSRLINDQEIEIDLGNGVKVTALRYTISTKMPANGKTETPAS